MTQYFVVLDESGFDVDYCDTDSDQCAFETAKSKADLCGGCVYETSGEPDDEDKILVYSTLA
jgi:hypothetical protein